jgi:hypothetical protein
MDMLPGNFQRNSLVLFFSLLELLRRETTMLLFVHIQLEKPFCFRPTPTRIAEVKRINSLDWMEPPIMSKCLVVHNTFVDYNLLGLSQIVKDLPKFLVLHIPELWLVCHHVNMLRSHFWLDLSGSYVLYEDWLGNLPWCRWAIVAILVFCLLCLLSGANVFDNTEIPTRGLCCMLRMVPTNQL